MKKVKFFVLGAIVMLTASCDNKGSISSDVTLNTDIDTLSYAYGMSLANQNLKQYLSQMSILTDTMEVRFEYMSRMQVETDSIKKMSLQNEMNSKIDSVKKVNEKNLSQFLSGVKKGYEASQSEQAFNAGISIGTQMTKMGDQAAKQLYGPDSKEKFNNNALLAGVITVLKGETPKVENAQDYLNAKAEEIQEARMKEAYAADIEAEKKFFEENAKKEGIITLPSGLQYKIIKEGQGDKPLVTDKVKVHYHGTLLDGTVFDSSVDRGVPAEFGVGQVIRGWTEALQLMPVGSKWILYVPSELGYGARGAGQQIKPFTPLVFEVELLAIEK